MTASFEPLSITAASLVSAVGADLAQTAGSIRAGLSGLAHHPRYEALARAPEWEEDEPLAVAAVPFVDAALAGPDRLFALLLPTIADLVRRAKLLRRDMEACALFLSLPGGDAVADAWKLADSFVPELCDRLGLAPKATRITVAGHGGMFELAAEASALFGRGEADACIVAGVESFLDERRLALLDKGYRLKSARNVDGYAPGEAASALLFETPRFVRSRHGEAIASITALGFGREPETFRSEKPSSGAGLTAALRAVLRDDAKSCEWALCDLNGESYRAFEWGVVRARLGSRLGDIRRLVHPAMSLGDVGAASGGALAGAAIGAMQRGYAPANEAILWTSSENGLRAAARITRP